MPDVRLCYRILKSCNVNYAKYKVKNKTQCDYLSLHFFAWTLKASLLAKFLVLKWKFQAILTVISQACSFLLVNTPLKAMGRLFKFCVLNSRKSRATSFWDGPPRIQGNWPNWPPSTGVNF